jgi:predicted AAA+ superfamily ATPase
MEVQLSSVIRDKILTAIEAPLPELTRRDVELPPARGKAMAIIGMRRAGKTSFLHQCRSDRIQAGQSPHQLLYFNFEDERLGELTASDLHLIPDTHLQLFPDAADQQTTFFLDEIQRVPGWEVFVRRMLDTPGIDIFLSGSSAKLLSRELATSMRGRAWEVTIQPFSFAEALRHQGQAVPGHPQHLTRKQATRLDHLYALYLQQGGFPEAQGLSLLHQRQLLQSYIDVLLLRDVIERHQVSNVVALRWLLRRLLSAPASLFSITKFAADLKSQAIPVGRETLYEYLDHLEDTFALQTMPVATDSEKRRQVNPRKAYPADTGLIPVFDHSGKANTGHALETSVFIELQRRAVEPGYVKTASGYEVDFLARYPDGREELIQVSQSVDDPKTLAREVRALQDAATEYPKASLVLLTLESRLPYPAVPDAIHILPAWQWMLDK